MYSPSIFAETDPAELHRVIRQYSFGLLVSQSPDGPMATHVPFLFEPGGRHGMGRLSCHLAKANPQWQVIADMGPVLAVFSGPHAYVSPGWYVKRNTVPTWNYVAVHAHGDAEIVQDATKLRRLVAALSAVHEAGRPAPWSVDELPAPALGKLLDEIVGIEIAVARLSGKRKLSQNRSAADRAGVVAGLRGEGHGPSLAIADAMAVGPKSRTDGHCPTDLSRELRKSD